MSLYKEAKRIIEARADCDSLKARKKDKTSLTRGLTRRAPAFEKEAGALGIVGSSLLGPAGVAGYQLMSEDYGKGTYDIPAVAAGLLGPIGTIPQQLYRKMFPLADKARDHMNKKASEKTSNGEKALTATQIAGGSAGIYYGIKGRKAQAKAQSARSAASKASLNGGAKKGLRKDLNNYASSLEKKPKKYLKRGLAGIGVGALAMAARGAMSGQEKKASCIDAKTWIKKT